MQHAPDDRSLREAARLSALASYDVLDTPRERDFDDVAALASAICGTPIAVVNLIGEGRQFFKAEVGLGVRETPLDSSFCARAILEEDFLLVPDATKDPRFDCNPLVVGEPHLRFYAGALLKTDEGRAIGTVCVLDFQPRDLTDVQQQTLRVLARQVMKQLELRRALAARDAFISDQEGVRRERSALSETQSIIAAAGGDLDAILDAVTSGVLRAVPAAEGAVVEMVDGAQLEYRAVAGNLASHRGLRLPLDDSLSGRCALTDAPILVEDVLQRGQVKPHLAERLALRAAALAPLSRAGRTVGVLKVQAGRPGALTERDLALVRLFAGVASSGLTEVAEAAVGRVQQRAQRRLDLLAQVSAALLTATHPARAVEPILAAAAGSLGFTHSYLYDITPDGHHLVLTQSVGASEDVQAALRHVAIDLPLCGLVATARRSVVLTDVLASDEPRYALARQIGINAFAGYPVTSRGSIVGVISFCATTEPAFDDEALSFFETVARYLSAVYERLDGEKALRESDARSRRAQEAGQIGTFEIDVTSGLMSVSREFCRIYGVPPVGLYSAERFEALILSEDRAVASSEGTRQGGTAAAEVEYRIRRADDGVLRWIARRADFVRDEGGAVVRMFGTVQDVTERRLVQARQAALLDLGDRLRQAGDTNEVVGVAARVLGQALDVARAGYAIIDVEADRFTVGQDWTAPGIASFIGQHRLSAFGATVDRLKRGEAVVVPNVAGAPWLGQDADSYEAIGVQALIGIPLVQRSLLVGVLFVHSGEVRTWTQAEVNFAHGVVDRTYAALAQAHAEAEQRLLNEELSHRLKNTLAMVLSIATQTLRQVTDREPVEAFEKRIYALSKAHDVLLQQSWTSAPMAVIARTVLGTFGHAERLSVSGPEVSLGPRATLSLSLVLHELATNAAKYGALSNATGHVDLHWRIDGANGASAVVMDWEERGGPPVREPSRRGFGSRLIRMGLVGAGDVDLHYPATGFKAELRAPLAQLQQS